MISRRSVFRRWLVPVAAVGLASLVGVLPHLISSATATSPNLPPITAAQLIDKVRLTQVRALSGTISLTSDLGLPSLGPVASLGGGGTATSIASLLSGTHTARLWVDGPEHLRVATIAPMAETNWVRNGSDLWSYDSSTLTATHATLPAHGGGDGSEPDRATTDAPEATGGAATPTETPQDLAQRLLDKVTPSTQVSVESTGTVAGRDVYRLVLSPDDTHSTIGRVVISVDATTGLPLNVTISARSSGATAIELGFTDISYSTPSPSEFAFAPPPGSTVVQAASPSALLSAGGNPDEAHRRHRLHRDGSGVAGPTAGPAPAPGTAAAKPVVLGSAWGSAVILSNSAITSQIGPLLQGAPTVAVGSSSARVISTALINVLVLDDGRVVVGAVDPDTLARLAAGA
ncbi:MAG: hypothetical protein WCH93_02685 [Actinomycetota bacterium]